MHSYKAAHICHPLSPTYNPKMSKEWTRRPRLAVRDWASPTRRPRLGVPLDGRNLAFPKAVLSDMPSDNAGHYRVA